MLSLSPLAPDPHAAEPRLRLAEGVDLLPGGFAPGAQPDGNTEIFDASTGLVVVDTGRHRAHAQRILDHVSGNVAVREAWPEAEVHVSDAIVAALDGFLAGYRVRLLGGIAKTADAAQAEHWREEVACIDAGPRLRPTVPVTFSGPRRIAGRSFRLGLTEAATPRGDVWLHDPETRALVAGDLVTLPAPLLDTACPARWRDALEELAAVDFAVLVPGHGVPMDRKGFNVYRRAFNNLLVRAAAPTRTRTCVAGWRRDAGALLTNADRETVDSMIACYVDARLRGPRAIADCGASTDAAP